jgi:CheY-like chemotaxis protein
MKPLAGLEIAVVEADTVGAKLTAVVLRDAGAVVTVAHDAESALQFIDAIHPKVVLIDLELPTMSSRVLVRLLRQLEWSADLCIVATTNHPGGERARRAALDLGCAGYFEKPTDERLVDVITEALGAKR